MSCRSEDILEFLLTRRSIRQFKLESVPDDVVLKILNASRYAPSAGNRQPWIFVVVKDGKIKEKLAGIHAGSIPLLRAPIGIVVACDKNTSPFSYQVDCANAAVYVMLVAHALGLGTVWIQTLRNIEEIQKTLELPENYVPIAILALGYPAEKPQPRPRKPLEEIVYLDKYGNKYST
ncbi:MAG: nitroreductase family protein [Sulfolobales archaeon]|nr:nitroreductase family protein [Sulfolobales archaeon]MDW8082851.1 nitroreductase family protein [Sulfolobales archaeon]